MVKNKVVLITGCSSGVGLAIAKDLYKKNYDLSICARNVTKLTKIFQNKNKILINNVDIKIEKNIKNLVKKTYQKYGKIDVLINNAGVCFPDKIENINDKNLNDTFKVNFFAPIYLIRECLPYMKKTNFGRIINISSAGAINCSKYYTTYSASKSALNTLAKSLSKELVGFNIKIYSFSPGPCKTKMFPKNPLSPEICLSSIKNLINNNKINSGEFFWFKKKVNIIPIINIDWSKPKKL